MTSLLVTPHRAGPAGSMLDAEAVTLHRQRPESPTRVSPGRIQTSKTPGKFEDPMLVWRSSQSDEGGHNNNNTSPTSSATKLHPVVGPPSSPSKQHRVVETVLDAVHPAATSPQSPANLASPIRSHSPTTRTARSGSTSASNTASPSATLFDKLRMFGSRGLFGGGMASEGGVRNSPQCKSLTFSGVDEICVADRSHSYSFSSPTRASQLSSPIPSNVPTSPFFGASSPRPQSIRNSSSGLSGSEDAAAAAVAAVDGPDRTSASSLAAESTATSLRSLNKNKSVGGRSMGGRAVGINPAWRSSGALTLSTAASGALPEGGLQSQTHEALQQLLGSSLTGEPSSKRLSTPGQPPMASPNHAPTANANGMVLGGGGRKVSRELGAHPLARSHHLLLTHNEEAPEAGEVLQGGSPGSLYPSGSGGAVPLMSLAPRGRRFTRATADKLDERLSLSAAVELSYADLDLDDDDGNDDDVF